MTKKNLVRVSILNEEYAIRSDESPEHTRAVAAYLESAVKRVLETGSVVETHRAVILAALQITAELFEAKATGGNAEMVRRIQDLSAEVRRMLPPVKRGEPVA
ncbi:MAG TPA: cell division protein ZapA [Gemmatimonadaceae bacterium]|nr:cell division protein ZapA [Gemmatimonadaceae bacterium]